MKTVAIKLTGLIYQENSNLTKQQLCKIQYGIECFLNESAKILFFLLVFGISSFLSEYLAALACLSILRPFVGGYHAKTNWGCYIVSLLFFVTVISLAHFYKLSVQFEFILIILSLIIVFLVSPVEHRNKPMRDARVRKILKVISIILTLFIFAVGHFLNYPFKDIVLYTVLCTVFMAVLGHYFYKKSLGKRG